MVPPSSSLPNLSPINGSNIPTLHHVPKGVRDLWALVLGDCLSSVVHNPDDTGLWARLFMLAKCVLASPAGGHKLRWREILRRVKSRLQRWSEGQVTELWSEALEDGRSLFWRAGQVRPSLTATNIRRAKQATQEGLYSKVINALTSKGLASLSPAILQEMLNKHPQAPPPSVPLDPAPQSVNLSEAILFKGVRSFPNGSSPGPSGLCPSHLREAVMCPSPDGANFALSALTRFTNLLAAGQAPPSVLPHLCGATLLASPKEKGGHRPIAVGEVLRRLTSKCLAMVCRSLAFSSLTPLQLGVGVKGGCEVIVHAVSNLLSSSSPSSCWTLMLDFTNAFNSVNREAMFVQIRQRIPSIAAWMESCYSCQPILHFGQDYVFSCCGVQQGDPLGPLDFALTLQPVIEKIKAEVPGLSLDAWYLDDGTLVGQPGDLAAALRIVEADGLALGLHLNHSKSLLYVPPGEDASQSPLPPDIPMVRRGFSLMGCPIGPPGFCEEVFSARLRKLKVSMETLSDMDDAQLETTLLRSCLALPKVSFVFRACPPSHFSHSSADFDTTMRRSLETIIGGPVSDWSWLKATLPSSRGGLNLRSASSHAPAAFLASHISSLPLVEWILGHPPSPSPHTTSVISALFVAAARPDWLSLDVIDVPIRQRHLSLAIDEAVYHQLHSSAPTTRARVLCLSSALSHAGDWLNVVPSATLGLRLQDKEFRCSLRYWLGIPLHNDPFPCPECRCSADIFGDHQVGCGGNGDRISRHNSIRDVVFTAAQLAALAPSKEIPGLVSGSLARPADVFLPSWSCGCPAALDIHVISPLQQQTLSQASVTPGHALQVGVQRKLASNLPACREAGVECIPLVVETLGGLAEDFIRTIRSLGQAIADRTSSWDPSYTTRHLFQRLAIALWRGNACLWLHRHPTLPPFLDGVV